MCYLFNRYLIVIPVQEDARAALNIFWAVNRADFEALIALKPIVITCSINYSLYMFESFFAPQGKRVDRVFDSVNQAGKFVEFASFIIRAGWAGFVTIITFRWAGIIFYHWVARQLSIRYYCAQTKKGSIARMIHLITSTECPETCADSGMLKREDPPGRSAMKYHGRVTRNRHRQMVALGFDPVGQIQGQVIQAHICRMIGAVEYVKIIFGGVQHPLWHGLAEDDNGSGLFAYP